VPNIGAPELLIIALLLLVLFGAKRLPDSARSLGRSLRIFKAETRGLRSDGDTVITPTGISAENSGSLHGTAGTTSPGPVPATPVEQQQRPDAQ
jgi:sec-independent protein translocase protein TatA